MTAGSLTAVVAVLLVGVWICVAPALTRLGTPSIKLGQLIASSPGTFPAALVTACSGLRDNVETDQGFDIESLLYAELGKEASRLRSVEATPISRSQSPR